MLLAAGYLCSFGVLAQPGWNWPEDEELKKTAMEKNALYSDLIKQKNYGDAQAPLEWLMTNAPNLNVAIYINGEKIYKALEKSTKKEDSLNQVYKQKVLSNYDQRMKYFNKKAYVMNKKALSAYQYYLTCKEPEKYQWIVSVLDSALELNGDKIHDALIGGYMQLTNILFQYKVYDTTKVFDNYSMLGDLMEKKLAGLEKLEGEKKKKKEQALADVQKKVDNLLIKTIKLDCPTLEKTFGSKFDADTTNVKFAKKFFALLLNGNCSDNPYFSKTAKVIYEAEPDFGLAKILAVTAAKNENTTLAIDYWEKAAAATEDVSKQAEAKLNVAKLYSNFNKPRARKYAIEAVKLDNSLSEAYSLVGNLYMNSFEDCKGGVSRVQDRAVFIAAYNWYKKAGDTSGMASAKNQFPSKTEAFEIGMDVNQENTIQIGCWINEAVVLKEYRE